MYTSTPGRSGRFISPWSNSAATDDITKRNYNDTGYAGCLEPGLAARKIGETWIAAVPSMAVSRLNCSTGGLPTLAGGQALSAQGFFFHRRQGPFCGSYLDLNASKKSPGPGGSRRESLSYYAGIRPIAIGRLQDSVVQPNYRCSKAPGDHFLAQFSVGCSSTFKPHLKPVNLCPQGRIEGHVFPKRRAAGWQPTNPPP